jgi:hypothetical protein
MKPTLLAILIIFIALAGCKNQVENTQLITVDMTGSLNTLPLHLNDYVSDLKVTRLETNNGSFINYFSGHVGDKYIISTRGDQVLLFNIDGEFIGTIANKGKGPGEYTYIDAWTVDDNEKRFLYHDVGKDYIYQFDLSNQQAAENIPFKDHGYLSEMILLNDSVLSILPDGSSDYGYLLFNQTITGQITGGIAKENVPHQGLWTGMPDVFKQNSDQSIMVHQSESDTVFSIQDTDISPEYVLLVEATQKSGDKTKGISASFVHQDESLVLIAKRRYESIIKPNSQSVTIFNPDYIVVDLKTMITSKIDKLSLEILGMDLDVFELSFPGRDRFFISYQALHFKNMIEDILKSEDVSDSQKKILEQLNSDISEYDNPIIISGKWK